MCPPCFLLILLTYVLLINRILTLLSPSIFIKILYKFFVGWMDLAAKIKGAHDQMLCGSMEWLLDRNVCLELAT